MSTDPSAVSYLEAARTERAEGPEAQIEELRTRLDTERSAGKAMLVTVLELERRIAAERQTGGALLAAVKALELTLVEERREQQTQRIEVQRLWGEVRVLEDELREAERPLWRKLLRRA